MSILLCPFVQTFAQNTVSKININNNRAKVSPSAAAASGFCLSVSTLQAVRVPRRSAEQEAIMAAKEISVSGRIYELARGLDVGDRHRRRRARRRLLFIPKFHVRLSYEDL